MSNSLKEKYLSSYFLTTLGFVKENEVVKCYLEFLSSFINSNDIEEDIKRYSYFVRKLNGADLSVYVKYLVLKNRKMLQEEMPTDNEFNIIKELFSFDFEFFKKNFIEKYKDYKNLFNSLPEFKNSEILFDNEDEIASEIDIFKENRAFVFDENLEIKPVNFTQELSFKDLKGYKQQKETLYNNTLAFLEGKKVNNILLYGDAGCGKSSSVRALLNEFPEINIIQIFKNNLMNLDKLYEKLYDIPKKFIIFADDISFSDTDSTFSTMKAILEGSLIECPQNAVIYATSNRRHLVKETFQSRIGDEIHLNDTINEISSLSERFGINLFFSKPTNDEFNQIVLELAKDNGIVEVEGVLIKKAQKFALLKGSRSPRVAKQMIENILAGIEI